MKHHETEQPSDVDLDLMAYADGMLDHDPERKRQVEALIADDPRRRQQLRDFLAQSEILRQAYAERLTAPVPARLSRLLELDERPRRTARPVLRKAVAALVVAGIGIGVGWQFGSMFHSGRSDGAVAEQFIRQSYEQFAEARSGRAELASLQSSGDVPVNWLSDRLSLRFRAPDLRSEGYSMVHRESVRLGESQMVRLEYAAPTGETFSLFLRPRWESQRNDVSVVTKADVSLAVWLDGPLAASLASDLPASRMESLARQVRGAMRAGNGLDSEIKPSVGAERQADLLPDGSGLKPAQTVPELPRGNEDAAPTLVN